MPTVDDNRLKGNFGASYVAARLSADCLVRPVAADTDVGVDLYCESVQDGKPYLHFWMQVKTGDQCSELNDGTASCSFSKEHLEYWQRQPVPVFAALVPMKWPPSFFPPIYIADVTGYLLHKIPGLTIRSTIKWEPDSGDCLKRFLEVDLPVTTAMQYCQRGMIASVETLYRYYEQINPLVPADEYQDDILNQIRKTAALSILSLWRRNKLCSNQAFRTLLTKVLEQFIPESGNWENYFALGLNSHTDAKFVQAIEKYERAKRSIDDDPNLILTEQWKQHLHEIDSQIQKAKNHEPV